MEILFESRYFLTESMVKELYRRTKLCSTQALLLYASCIYFLARTLWALLFGGYILPLFPILAAYVLVRHFFGYRRAVNQTMGSETEKPTEQHFTVTEKAIIMDDHSTGILFSTIEKVYQTKNLIILITKGKLAIMLPKNSFTKGTPEDLLLFLIRNGFKIR